MRIAWLASWDEAYEPIAKITVPAITDYCNRHGYSFIPFTDSRPLWGRFHGAALHLDDYDMIAVTDIDLAPINHSVTLESFNKASCQYTADRYGFNCGIILLTPEARPLLTRMLQLEEHYSHWPNAEQTSLAYTIPQYPNLCHCWNQRAFNSYLYKEWYHADYPEGQYHQGDFILHAPGLSLNHRIKALRTALNRSQGR